MANKLAKYKQDYFLDSVQKWWDDPMTEHNEPIYSLYVSYINYQARDLEYEAIIHLDEFRKCLYANGIVNVSFKDTDPMYKQLEDWRPSTNQVLRHG